jgi:hypothetical protein
MFTLFEHSLKERRNPERFLKQVSLLANRKGGPIADVNIYLNPGNKPLHS